MRKYNHSERYGFREWFGHQALGLIIAVIFGIIELIRWCVHG